MDLILFFIPTKAIYHQTKYLPILSLETTLFIQLFSEELNNSFQSILERKNNRKPFPVKS